MMTMMSLALDVDHVDHHKFFLIVFKHLPMVFSHSTSVKDINGYNQSIPI